MLQEWALQSILWKKGDESFRQNVSLHTNKLVQKFHYSIFEDSTLTLWTIQTTWNEDSFSGFAFFWRSLDKWSEMKGCKDSFWQFCLSDVKRQKSNECHLIFKPNFDILLTLHFMPTIIKLYFTYLLFIKQGKNLFLIFRTIFYP